jgi:hypothetical protein
MSGMSEQAKVMLNSIAIVITNPEPEVVEEVIEEEE